MSVPIEEQLYYEEDALATVSELVTSLTQALQKTPLPVLTQLNPLKQQHNAFQPKAQPGKGPGTGGDSAGPNLVRVIIVAGSSEELETVRTFLSAYDTQAWLWRPYRPDNDRTIGAEVQIITGERDLRCEFIEADDNVCARIREAANRNEIVLVLADPWTLRLPKYANRLQPFDQIYLLNCALLMVWNGKDDETKQQATALEEELRNVFQNKTVSPPPPGHVFYGIDTYGEFVSQLRRALVEAQLRIIDKSTRHRRAESAALQQQAELAGINVSNRATLQGPVGGPS